MLNLTSPHSNYTASEVVVVVWEIEIILINFKRASKIHVTDRMSLIACTEKKSELHTRKNKLKLTRDRNCHGMLYAACSNRFRSQMKWKRKVISCHTIIHVSLSLAVVDSISSRINVKWRITEWLLLPRFHLSLSRVCDDSNSLYNKRRAMRCD